MEFLVTLIFFLANLPEHSFPPDPREDVVRVIDDAPCFEGKNHILICELKKKVSVVKWMNGSNVDPIVHCHKNSCDLNPDYEGQYDYSFDPAKNIISLIILNVNKTNNGMKFVCSDGTNRDCRVLDVAEYAQSLEETETGKITATSACSSPGRNVSIKWIKRDHVSKEEVEFKPKFLNRTVIHCLGECGKNSQLKYRETISAFPGGNGSKNYLKMTIVYGTERTESIQSNILYTIEEEAGAEENEYVRSNLVIVPVVVVVVSAIVVAAALNIYIYWKIVMSPNINSGKRRFVCTFIKTDKNSKEDNKEERPFINADIKKNEDGSADQEKGKGPVTTMTDYQHSDEEYTDPNLDDNLSIESIDVKENCRVDIDENCLSKLLPNLNLLEKEGEEDDYGDYGGINGMETFEGIIVDGNDSEYTRYEVPEASNKDEEATAAGINTRDYQFDSLRKLSKISVKETCGNEHFAAIAFERNMPVSVKLTKISAKAIPSCIPVHDLNTESSMIPKLDISEAYLTISDTEVESKDSGSI